MGIRPLLVFILLPLFLTAQESLSKPSSEWFLDFDSALKQSKESNRNVLIYFSGSDWCGPCKMLKKDLFDSSEFLNIAKDYVLLYIDLPRNRDLISSQQYEHNKALLAKFNKRGVFPMVKILNEHGKVLDEYAGYSMTGDVRYHMQLLEKYAP